MSSESVEGVKGVCLLCTKETVVLLPHQSKNIIFKLFGLLENQINVQKYKPAFCGIQACFSCLFKIETMDKLKEGISNVCENHSVCSLCEATDTLLVSTKCLHHFHREVEKFLSKKMSPTECAICLKCIVYFDWLKRIKDNLLKKYSFLKLSHKIKSHETLERQLRGLKPLKDLDLHLNVNEEDAKLWAKVPYVKLNSCKLKKKGSKAAKKAKPKLNRKPKILKVKLWQNLKKVSSSSSRKAKSIKKELVVNIIKTQIEQQTTVTENLELEQMEESNVALQTSSVSSDEEWTSMGQRSYVEHIQQNNDAIFNELLLKAEKQNSCQENGEMKTENLVLENSPEEVIEIDQVPHSSTDQPETNGTMSSDQTEDQNHSQTQNLVCCNKQFEKFSDEISCKFDN